MSSGLAKPCPQFSSASITVTTGSPSSLGPQVATSLRLETSMAAFVRQLMQEAIARDRAGQKK
jgi:hypothetical protein